MRKHILKACLCTLLFVLSARGPEPILHPEHGAKLMRVPQGCKIGSVKAPSNGLYIAGDLIITVE